MTILVLALFGSCARQDNDVDSDVDLLGVVEGKIRSSRSDRRTNLSLYGAKLLYSMGRAGDLFALHLVSEARVLYDEIAFFPRFKQIYRYKDSYFKEIRDASEVGWFIIRNIEKFNNPQYANKRLAWSVRTILIARAAEQRVPVFSADALTEFSKIPDLKNLIKAKALDFVPRKNLELLPDVISKFGTPEFPVFQSGSLSEIRSYFTSKKNPIGLSTVKSLLEPEPFLSAY